MAQLKAWSWHVWNTLTALTAAQISADEGMRQSIIDALLAFEAAIRDWQLSGG